MPQLLMCLMVFAVMLAPVSGSADTTGQVALLNGRAMPLGYGAPAGTSTSFEYMGHSGGALSMPVGAPNYDAVALFDITNGTSQIPSGVAFQRRQWGSL